MRSTVLILLAVFSACSGGAGIRSNLGESRIQAQVGPGGRELRGDGGTDLDGFRLTIPEGALDRLVLITIEPGPDIGVDGTRAIGAGFRVRVEPDPGPLRLPATIQIAAELPEFVAAKDLVLVSRPLESTPTAISDTTPRVGVMSDTVIYDRDAEAILADTRLLSDFQVRLATDERLSEDALRLVSLGFDALVRGTDPSLREADLLFAQAQDADPFAPAANLFRAISRVLVVLNDRDDTTAGLDSLGEVVARFGIDVTAKSLLTRVLNDDWPRNIVVPRSAPSVQEIVAMLRTRLAPALELALRDLDSVPPSTGLIIRVPSGFGLPPGDRELDAADVLFLRSLFALALGILEMAEDLDLELDVNAFTSGALSDLDYESRLALAPTFGTLRARPDESTIETMRAALTWWLVAFEALAAETDPQEDDLLVFPSSFGDSRRDLWRSNLQNVLNAMRVETIARVVFEDGSGALSVEPLRPWRAGALNPRAWVPDLFEFLPVAGTLPDPTLGGFLPDMTQTRATELIGAANVHRAPQLNIVADGSFGDWTGPSEALLPADPVGDLGATSLDAVDLRRVWFAESGDNLALRIQVEGDIVFRGNQRTVYGAVIRDVRSGRLSEKILIEVYVNAQGYEVRVGRNGIPRTVRAEVAARGSDIEVLLDRFDLLDPDEPIADRAVTVFSDGISLLESGSVRDETRPFIVRF